MQATCSSETSSTFLSMEKTRRKSSASEFFSRRHSSSLFQSMRRYSSSTLFSGGAGAGSSSWRSAGGRRHSSSQLVPSPAHQLQGDTARPALGDVAELQETGRQIHRRRGRRQSRLCWNKAVRGSRLEKENMVTWCYFL